MAAERRADILTFSRMYLTREPVMLALLSLLAVVCFLAVGGLSRAYHAQQESLGNRWYGRGVADLNARRFDAAVAEFRAALRYSRDNYSYQLNLAEALVGLQRTGEAQAYFINLWDREPEDGLVNLELARIAVQRRQIEQALRYYHNALYAIWPGDQEVQRRAARLELIEFLLQINAKTQAQAEMIALAANQGDDAAQQAQIGDLFMLAQDYEHALAAYRQSLRSDHAMPDHATSDHAVPELRTHAMAGAGFAALELGRYPLAERYLQAAVAADPNDKQSAASLQTTELVLRMDPFQRDVSVAQRDRIVLEAFAVAGERLKTCGATEGARGSAVPGASSGDPAAEWMKLKPRINEMELRRNPDLVEKAMEVVFNIERQTSVTCGAPVGTDMALLLIAKLHEGN